MNKVLTLPLLAVVMVATLPHAGAVLCYMCQGYNSSFPESDVMNTKYCSDENFENAFLSKENGSTCIAMVKEHGGLSLTVRAHVIGNNVPIDMREMENTKTQYITFKGYFCNGDLCNDYAISQIVPAARALS